MRQLVEVQHPIWQDIETKDRILARFNYDDGSSVVMSIAADPIHEDFQQFLKFSSIEAVDEHTQTVRDDIAAKREKAVAQQADQADQKKAGALFNAKVEAFDMPVVQNASKEWKAKIRKASSTIEVIATVAALVVKQEIDRGADGVEPTP